MPSPAMTTYPKSSMQWQTKAACTGETTAKFFTQQTTAKAICARCPVKAQCLQWALDTRQDYGVWGGLTDRERRKIHRRQAR